MKQVAFICALLAATPAYADNPLDDQILLENPQLKRVTHTGSDWFVTAKKRVDVATAASIADGVCNTLNRHNAGGSNVDVNVVDQATRLISATTCKPLPAPATPQPQPAKNSIVGDLILLAFVIGVPVFVIWHVRKSAAEKRAGDEWWARRQSIIDQNEDTFEREASADWPIMLSDFAGVGGSEGEYLMMSADQCRIRRAGVEFYPELKIRNDRIIDCRTIVSVEVQRESRTFMHLDMSSRTATKGAYRRAFAGEILFGPVGGIVAGATAPTETHGTMSGEQKTVYGPIDLVIGTTDLYQPVIKMRMRDMDVAETWMHRIKGAIALCQRRAEVPRNGKL